MMMQALLLVGRELRHELRQTSEHRSAGDARQKSRRSNVPCVLAEYNEHPGGLKNIQNNYELYNNSTIIIDFIQIWE